jgi:hypothetical protein
MVPLPLPPFPFLSSCASRSTSRLASFGASSEKGLNDSWTNGHALSFLIGQTAAVGRSIDWFFWQRSLHLRPWARLDVAVDFLKRHSIQDFRGR